MTKLVGYKIFRGTNKQGNPYDFIRVYLEGADITENGEGKIYDSKNLYDYDASTIECLASHLGESVLL